MAEKELSCGQTRGQYNVQCKTYTNYWREKSCP